MTRANRGTPLLEAALELASRGWPVFPCSPNTKQPLVPKSTSGKKDGGLYRATTDEAQIRAWWGKYPSAMIGLPTGEALGAFVIDLDPKGGETPVQLLAKLEERLGVKLPPAPICRTPRGGWHVYYAMPPGIKIGNRSNLLGVKGDNESKIDVKGIGGYVIAPPSVRAGGQAVEEGCAGVPYAWMDDAVDAFDPHLPPQELVDLILRQGKFDEERAARDAPPTNNAATADDRQRAYALKAFDEELQNVRAAAEGTRNDTLNIAAMKLGQLIGAGTLSEAVVTAALEEIARGWPNFAKSQSTIRSGLAKGKSEPRDLSGIGRASSTGRVSGSTSATPVPAAGSGEGPPAGGVEIDRDKVAANALEKTNDTGNGRRLRRWFGTEILWVRNVGPHIWAGTHWDPGGADETLVRMAQIVSDRIHHEAECIEASREDREILDAADAIHPAILRTDLRAKGITAEQKEAKIEAMVLIKRADLIRARIAERQKARVGFAVASGNAARINGMIGMECANMTVAPEDMDAEPLAINVLNGTLRLVREEIDDPECPDPDATRKIEVWRVRLDPHKRSDRISKIMPVKYDPKAECPEWLKFMERFQPKPRIRDFLQIFHGYSLTALTGEQAFLFNWGLGANGKTTFLEQIASIMGNYAAVLPAEALTGDLQRRGDQATPEFARLPGARLVRCAELPRGQGFREHTLKLLTGGEMLLVRHLHRDFFEMRPTFKAVGSGNDQPSIGGVDEGIWRRMKLIPWEVTIPPAERKPMARILRQFQREAPGILNWMLDGLLMYLEGGGLKTPPEIQEATDSYRADMDPVGEFTHSHIRRMPGNKVRARALYQAYVAYCHVNSVRPFTEKTFAKIMQQKGFKKKSAAVVEYLDIELVDVPMDPEIGPPDGGRC